MGYIANWVCLHQCIYMVHVHVAMYVCVHVPVVTLCTHVSLHTVYIRSIAEKGFQFVPTRKSLNRNGELFVFEICSSQKQLEQYITNTYTKFLIPYMEYDNPTQLEALIGYY